MRRITAWLMVFSLLLLTACGQGEHSDSSGLGGSATRQAVQSAELQFSAPQQGAPIAVIKTDSGEIGILLYPDYAPQAVENFRLLCEKETYTQSTFHRVVPELLIQGGPAGADGTASAWGAPFPNELTDKLRHYSGALCTVSTKAGRGANGGGFYIVATPQDSVTEETQQTLLDAGCRESVVSTYAQAGGAPYLDNTDTVFGQVIWGMDIVDTICSAKVDDDYQPAHPVTVQSITFSTYSEEAAAPSSAENAASAGSTSSLPAGTPAESGRPRSISHRSHFTTAKACH